MSFASEKNVCDNKIVATEFLSSHVRRIMEPAMDKGTLRQELARSRATIASLREQIKLISDELTTVKGQNEALQQTVTAYACENDLLKRRLFGTKSERTNTSEFQLILQGLLPEDEKLRKQFEKELAPGNTPEGGDKPKPDPERKPRPKPTGRRNLALSNLPRITVNIENAELAKQGRVINWDESYELMRLQGGFRVLVKRTAIYETQVAGRKTVLAAVQPPRVFERSMSHVSVYAWLACQKFALGVPHYRLEQHLAGAFVSIDRGTMSRYMEDLGGTLGATIVEAMLKDARANCHVLSTDATGAAIQPIPSGDGRHQACKKGHFFTIVADREHVLYHYAESHTSNAVADLFKGFTGLLQADASSVYDVLERRVLDSDETNLKLVGCWAHCRRYFFEASICRYPGALDGLVRIREMYSVESLYANAGPRERHAFRATMLAPLMDDFFSWVKTTRRGQRGRTKFTQALVYASNQEQELRRVLDNGRLPLDNTRSERALRRIVVGRKNWLFYGSDVHAESAASIFSIVASCRLHRLDPEQYLCDVLRALPHWPPERYIELAPSRWAHTRSRLDTGQLAHPLCEITVPQRE